MPSLAVETMGVRLGVAKQSFFGLPGQYDRRVTRAEEVVTQISLSSYYQEKHIFPVTLYVRY